MQSVLGRARGDCADVATPGRARRLLARPFLWHNALMLIATVSTGALNFLFHPVLEHRLGASAYGTVASLLALLAILLIPTPIIGTIVARYASALSAAGRLDQLNGFVRRLTALLLPLGVGLTLIFALASNAIALFFHLNSSQSLLILGLALAVSFANPVNLGAVQGLQRFGWYATLTVMPAIVRLVLAAALVVWGFGVNGAVMGIALGALLPYILSFQPLRSLLAGPCTQQESLRSLWRYSLTAAVALACTTLLFNLDTVLAKHFLLSTPAGFYAAMATVGRTSLFVTSSVVAVMFPRVASLQARGESTLRVTAQSLAAVLGLSAVAEIAFIAAPGHIMNVFGHEFVAVAGQLTWYGLAMVLLAQAQALVYYFLSTGGRMFVLVLPVCCALLAVLVELHHQTVAEIVQAVLVANGLLLAALLALFIAHVRREQRGVGVGSFEKEIM